MIILNLGVDNSGKTTLSEKILRLDKSIRYIKPQGVKSKDNQIKFLNASLAIALEFGNPHILYERYPLFEELVYGKVLRGEGHFDMPDQDPLTEILIKRLRKADHTIIFNDPGFETITKSITHRPQMEGVVKNIEMLYSCYKQLVHTLIYDYHLNVITHNYNLPDKDFGSTQSIIDYLKENLIYE